MRSRRFKSWVRTFGPGRVRTFFLAHGVAWSGGMELHGVFGGRVRIFKNLNWFGYGEDVGGFDGGGADTRHWEALRRIAGALCGKDYLWNTSKSYGKDQDQAFRPD